MSVTTGTKVEFSLGFDGMHTFANDDSVQFKYGTGLYKSMSSGGGLGAYVLTKLINMAMPKGKGSEVLSGFSSNVASSTHYDVSFTFAYDFSTSDEPNIAGHPSDVIIGGGVDLIVTEGYLGEMSCFLIFAC